MATVLTAHIDTNSERVRVSLTNLAGDQIEEWDFQSDATVLNLCIRIGDKLGLACVCYLDDGSCALSSDTLHGIHNSRLTLKDTDLERITAEESIEIIHRLLVEPLLESLRAGTASLSSAGHINFNKVVARFGDDPTCNLCFYNYYVSIFRQYCAEYAAEMECLDGDALLKGIAEGWLKFGQLVQDVRPIFQYLDRSFTRNSVEFEDLFTAAVRCFRDQVYAVKRTACIKLVIDAMTKERDGIEVPRELLRCLVRMFSVLADKSPELRRNREKVHEWVCCSESSCTQSRFHSDLLIATECYYEKKMTELRCEASNPGFVELLKRECSAEEKRLTFYLDRRAVDELMAVARRSLVETLEIDTLGGNLEWKQWRQYVQ